MGRPSEFTPELANSICERLSDGESLRGICEGEGLPDRTTVRRWLAQNDEFRLQYARAREEQADAYAEKLVAEAFGATDASIGRLRMDALKWAASKLAPKRYGDKVQNEHSGPDGQPIAIERIERVVVRPSNPDR